MTSDEFYELAKQLRELGALKVKAGDLEVVFGLQAVPKTVPVTAETPRREPKKKPMTPEEERLALYREELGEA